MPEYPDILRYIEALKERLLHQTLTAVKLNSPFLLRTATPPIHSFIGKEVNTIERVGKRIAIGLGSASEESNLWMVFHLMIAGRFH